MKTLTYLLFTLSFLFSNEINCQSWHSLIHENPPNLLQESVSDNKGMIAYPLINKDIMGHQNEDFFADSVIVRYGMYADQKWIYTYNEAGFVSTKTIKVLENGIFKISGLINYIYNQNNNLIEEVRFQWNDTVWVNSYRQIYEYNNNKITRWKTQMWYNNQWTNNYDNIYTYNNNEYLVLYEHNAWQQNTWEYRWKEEYTYNQSNQLDSLIEFSYSDDSTWRKNHLFKHEYCPAGNLEAKNILVWRDSIWTISRKRTYEYDSINRLIEYAYYFLYENGWIHNYYKYDYAYDENDNMIYELHYYGEDTVWNYRIKTIMEYDEFNNKTSEYQYKFDTIDSTWYYHRFNDYYHDYLNNVSFVTTYIWDEDEWIVFSDYSLTFTLFGRTIVENAIAHYVQCHYSGILAGDKKIKYNPNIQINCFPNPATDIINISSPEIIEQLKIIDNSGKVVYNRDVNAERLVSINTAIFKPGVYYISVMTKKGIIVEKVIIIF